MPDPVIQPAAPANPMNPDSIAAHNTNIARQLAAQDAAGHTMAPHETEGAQTALDKLFSSKEAELKKAAGDAPPPAETVIPASTDPRDNTPADPASVKAAADAVAAKAIADAVPAAEPTPEQKRADELFRDSPQLPSGASPKSADAFNFVKTEAAKRVLELEAREADLKAKLEAASKPATPTTQQLEQEKEYKELKAWRAKVDVEFDPAFKEFDQKVSEASEFVYAQLRKSPVITEDHITAIKKLGGPTKVLWPKIFDTIKDATLQQLIQSQVSDIAKIEYQKERRVTEAKERAEEFMQERETHWKNQATAHTLETQNQLDTMLKSLDWFSPKKAADNAPEAEKKSAEDHNAFLAQTQDQIKAALTEDSPQMRAVLIAGMAQFFNLQRVHTLMKTALAALQKEHAALVDKFAAVKQSATTRLREGAAPAEGVRPAKPATPGTTMRTADAVDELAKQVMAERQAKGLPV